MYIKAFWGTRVLAFFGCSVPKFNTGIWASKLHFACVSKHICFLRDEIVKALDLTTVSRLNMGVSSVTLIARPGNINHALCHGQAIKVTVLTVRKM